MNDRSALFQKLDEGVGQAVKDEYSITFTSMSRPQDLLVQFAMEPNKVISQAAFTLMGVFKKRAPGRIEIGDIYDIDALGLDNGSIVIVETSTGFGKTSQGSAWFAIHTIKCDKTGSHPECGAREFGFERLGSGVKFYTRGVSRPANILVQAAGVLPQNTTWNALIQGFKDAATRSGGKWDNKPVYAERKPL